MSFLRSYLNDKKVQKVLAKKPGDEGFSLVELVVVIAVLAILSAVAIPAFQGVQERAKTSAVKNGLVNGVKECIVSSGLGEGEVYSVSQAFSGDYTGYDIKKYAQDSCFRAKAVPDSTDLPTFYIEYDKFDGTTEKTCEYTTKKGIGCNTDGTW